jgi:amidase
MSRNLATVEKYMEALPAASPWEIDPHVTPIQWRTELCTTTKRLKIGYVIDDGVVKVQPPVARAVREVVDALKAAGHEGKVMACWGCLLKSLIS